MILFFEIVMISLQYKKYKEKYKIDVCENIELKKSNEDLIKKIQTLKKSLIQANKIDKFYTIEKLREEIACLTKDFEKFLESSNTLTMLLKFHQHPHDKSGLRVEKRASSSKSQSVLNKCDFYGKSRHSKFRCIHKKKQISNCTNAYGPKKILVPKSEIVPVANILDRKRPGFKLVPE